MHSASIISLVETFPGTLQVMALTPLSPGRRQECSIITLKDSRSHFNTVLNKYRKYSWYFLMNSSINAFHCASDVHTLMIFTFKKKIKQKEQGKKP